MIFALKDQRSIHVISIFASKISDLPELWFELSVFHTNVRVGVGIGGAQPPRVVHHLVGQGGETSNELRR